MSHWQVQLNLSRGQRAPAYWLPRRTRLHADISMASEPASFSIADETNTVVQEITRHHWGQLTGKYQHTKVLARAYLQDSAWIRQASLARSHWLAYLWQWLNGMVAVRRSSEYDTDD